MRFVLRAVAVAVAMILSASVARAQEGNGLQFVPLGYQQITSISAAKGLTVPAGATRAVIEAEAQAVRYRDDGTDPTATVGMPLAVGQPITYTSTLSKIRFIEQTSGGIVNVLYYK